MRNLLNIYRKLIRKFLASVFRKRVGWKKKITKILKSCYLFILLPVDLAGHLLTFYKSNSKLDSLNKVLIIKNDQFGDVLFSTFLVPLIRENYPNAEVHYLINPKTEVLLKGNPNITKIYFWQDPMLYFILGRKEEHRKKGFFDLIKEDYKTLKLIRKEKYDLIINTRAFVPSSNVVFKLMNPKVLSAFDISEQSFLADYCANYDFSEEEWKSYLKLLGPLQIKTEKFSTQFYNFDHNGFEEKFPNRKENLITIAPISFDKERLWKKEYWQAVIHFLIDNRYQIALTGLSSQANYLSQLAEPFNKDKVKIFTNLSIPQLASLMKFSQFVMCIDAFAVHLAISLKKSSICLINPNAYFLAGFSKPRIFIETKSMVPLIKSVTVLPLQSSAEEMIIHFRKLDSLDYRNSGINRN